MNKVCPKCGVNWINGTQRVCSECHEFTLPMPTIEQIEIALCQLFAQNFEIQYLGLEITPENNHTKIFFKRVEALKKGYPENIIELCQKHNIALPHFEKYWKAYEKYVLDKHKMTKQQIEYYAKWRQRNKEKIREYKRKQRERRKKLEKGE
ncbi:MAG TPA: hypothetical protein PKK61_05595 [Defluviitaleaceae bacterium]|nr:hypothetical protein [Defluviitaleaceae bacterium]